MRDRYDIVYVSPHLDDVALSCGGSVFENVLAGKSVLIVTLFTGEPPARLSDFARRYHEMTGMANDNAMAPRLEEDRRSGAILGADVEHAGLLDAVYRSHAVTRLPLYPSHRSIFGAPRPEDGALVEEVERNLRGLPRHREIVGPLAAGNHVDHQLTRAALQRCFGSSVWHYEDYPYVESWLALRRALKPRRAWRQRIQRLSHEAVLARCDAINAHASQVPMLFGSRAALLRKISASVRRRGGERLWQRRGAEPET